VAAGLATLSRNRRYQLVEEVARAWLDYWVYQYCHWRYGPSWRWYWLNWETNQEILI